ncbi:hypothetical protein ACLOJK_003362 [Asimina triloba]
MYTDYSAPPEHLLWCSIIFVKAGSHGSTGGVRLTDPSRSQAPQQGEDLKSVETATISSSEHHRLPRRRAAAATHHGEPAAGIRISPPLTNGDDRRDRRQQARSTATDPPPTPAVPDPDPTAATGGAIDGSGHGDDDPDAGSNPSQKRRPRPGSGADSSTPSLHSRRSASFSGDERQHRPFRLPATSPSDYEQRHNPSAMAATSRPQPVPHETATVDQRPSSSPWPTHNSTLDCTWQQPHHPKIHQATTIPNSRKQQHMMQCCKGTNTCNNQMKAHSTDPPASTKAAHLH